MEFKLSLGAVYILCQPKIGGRGVRKKTEIVTLRIIIVLKMWCTQRKEEEKNSNMFAKCV